MMAMALTLLDLFLKTKEKSFSWRCALGSFFILMGLGFGLYFGFGYLVPFLGLFETGMLLSGVLLVIGGLLMVATRPKKHSPVLNKALDTIKDKTEDLHLKEIYEKHKELIVAASVVAGILLPILTRRRKV